MKQPVTPWEEMMEERRKRWRGEKIDGLPGGGWPEAAARVMTVTATGRTTAKVYREPVKNQ